MYDVVRNTNIHSRRSGLGLTFLYATHAGRQNLRINDIAGVMYMHVAGETTHNCREESAPTLSLSFSRGVAAVRSRQCSLQSQLRRRVPHATRALNRASEICSSLVPGVCARHDSSFSLSLVLRPAATAVATAAATGAATVEVPAAATALVRVCGPPGPRCARSYSGDDVCAGCSP